MKLDSREFLTVQWHIRATRLTWNVTAHSTEFREGPSKG